MSQLHLNAFLSDVQSLNPGFRVETSSLKGLVQHLQTTVNHPVGMTEKQALKHCARFRAGRVSKYLPAIRRLVGVWGQKWRPYPQAPSGNMLAEIDIQRICFRGDSRPPSEIFPVGFTKRGTGMSATYRGGRVEPVPGKPNPVFDKIAGLKKAGDLLPASAVCVTPDMHVAALFPLPVITVLNNFKPTEVDTWIYMVYVASGSHTHGRQVLDALDGLDALQQVESHGIGNYSAKEVTEARIDEIMQNLYGREMATDQISPTSIWYGFRIRRNWNKTEKRTSWTEKGEKVVGYEGDYKEGGRYTVLEVQRNTAAVYPKIGSYVDVASSLAEDLSRGGKTFVLPTHKAGFAPSHVRALI